jgi:hypothetical protein
MHLPITGHRGKHGSPTKQVCSGPCRFELVQSMPLLEVAEFVTQNGCKFGFGPGPK